MTLLIHKIIILILILSYIVLAALGVFDLKEPVEVKETVEPEIITVIKEVPVEIIKEVPIETISIKEIIKEIFVPVEKIVYVDQECVECQECPVEEQLELSEHSVSIEKTDLSSDFVPDILLRNKDYLTMFTEAKLCAWEYFPTRFWIKKFTIELTGSATNDDFLNASWQGKYFYKVGDSTLVWDHSYEIEPANFDCVDFYVDITGIKNPFVTFQFQITESSLDIHEGGFWSLNDQQVGVVGEFPIYSWWVVVGE